MKKALAWVAAPMFVAAALGASCDNPGELLKHDHMNLGVRFDSGDPQIVREFKHALNFWSKILDMEWHENSDRTCSIDLIEGTPDGINGTADALTYHKSIAWGIQSSGTVGIDSGYKLTTQEWYAVAVHELGHMFGLRHNSSPKSVMYYMSVHGDQALDMTDIAALSAVHKVRISLSWLGP